MRGSGRSLGGGEGVGGPCTVNPTHVHSLSVAHFMHSLVCCCEAPSEGHMEQPHTYGISCNRGCSSQILPFWRIHIFTFSVVGHCTLPIH